MKSVAIYKGTSEVTQLGLFGEPNDVALAGRCQPPAGWPMYAVQSMCGAGLRKPCRFLLSPAEALRVIVTDESPTVVRQIPHSLRFLEQLEF